MRAGGGISFDVTTAERRSHRRRPHLGLRVSPFNFRLLPRGRQLFPSHTQISQRNPEQHFNLPLGDENVQKSRSYLPNGNS